MAFHIVLIIFIIFSYNLYCTFSDQSLCHFLTSKVIIYDFCIYLYYVGKN